MLGFEGSRGGEKQRRGRALRTQGNGTEEALKINSLDGK